MRIHSLRPDELGTVQACHQLLDAARRVDQPEAGRESLAGFTAGIQTPSQGWDHHFLVGQHDFGAPGGEAVVAVGEMLMPLEDNLTHAFIEVWVGASFRRHGFGSLMLTALEDEARRCGRSVVSGEVIRPTGVAAAGSAFATARDYAPALVELGRRLELPVPPETLDELHRSIGDRASAYQIRQSLGRVPDDLIDSYAELAGTMDVEAPSGDLVFEPSALTPGRVRSEERSRAASGRRVLASFAVLPTGDGPRVVGYTNIDVREAQPEAVLQQQTLVAPAHRGHRLGLALKVANLQQLQARFPAAQSVQSFNAEVNAPMAAINDRLGFVVTQTLTQVTRSLG